MTLPAQAPVATVIIPAHDEETTIRRTLESLAGPAARDTERMPVQIIVVANGCRDRTADVSRDFPGVEVLDLRQPSKIHAIRAADAIALSPRRIYLDADVVLGDGALASLVDALGTDEAIVAAPRPTFDTDGASWAVRAFYDVFARLPYVRTSLGNACVYGLSSAGRRRFGDFPDVVADDLFVQSLFAPGERIVTDGTVRVRTPRDLRNLLRMRTRVARGNAALATADHGRHLPATSGTVTALGSLARSPLAWPGIAVYVAVTLVARVRARRARGREVSWERDSSTRATG